MLYSLLFPLEGARKVLLGPFDPLADNPGSNTEKGKTKKSVRQREKDKKKGGDRVSGREMRDQNRNMQREEQTEWEGRRKERVGEKG